MLEPREVERWQRLTDAMLKHAAADDAAAFAQVVALIDRAQAKLPAVADQLRLAGRSPGEAGTLAHSWTDLGLALGVTRSAAQQRFGSHRITLGLDDK